MERNKNRYGEGTYLKTRMFLSPAFLSLGQQGSSSVVSSCSVQMLILLLGKRTFIRRKTSGKHRKYVRTDDNKISLTYKELESRGISQQRATRAFDELLAKGFISIANPGGLYDRDKALYALEDDYRMWRPGVPPIRERQRDVKRGYQGKRLGATDRSEKTKIAHADGGHPHARPQGTPHEKTHTQMGVTL